MARRSIALVVILLALVAEPVFAHDSASGPPDVTITVTNRLSDPDVLVAAGTIVRFTNADTERHRFRSRDGAGFDTGDIEPGRFAQVRLGSARTYAYIDERTDDPRYTGRIVVRGGSAGSGDATGTPGTQRRTATVTMADRSFQPATTRLAAGGSVTFRNADSDDHTATGGIIDSGTLSPGATYRRSFPKAGTYDFLCIFHPDMRGTIEVIGATKPEPSTPQPTSSPTPAATAPSADTSSVDIVDLAFQPASLEVPSGGTVRWMNSGVVPHTATADDATFDSGTLMPGATFEYTFKRPGTYTYLCNVHPDMTGSISVTETVAAAAPVGSAGRTLETPAVNAAAPVTPAPPAKSAASPEEAPVRGPATVDAAPAADITSLGGIALAVLMVSIASALFARVLRGTVRT